MAGKSDVRSDVIDLSQARIFNRQRLRFRPSFVMYLTIFALQVSPRPITFR